jgi:hypothetical protein
VLVQQHPEQQGERVAVEQLVGHGVLGQAGVRTAPFLPDRRMSWCARWSAGSVQPL